MTTRITKRHLGKRIFLLRFGSQYELAATFLRVQEHYESSRFRGRVFTLEEFMDWYVARFGRFSYYEDWSGFNVPSTALVPFSQGAFDPLSRKERRLLALFRRERAPFYVIGISREATRRDLVHELAHALYFTDPDYRRAVRLAIRPHDTSALARALLAMTYHPRVVADEVHAYLIAPGDTRQATTPRLRPLRRTLRALFTRHAAGLSIP